jgi:hypothetical protein
MSEASKMKLVLSMGIYQEFIGGYWRDIEYLEAPLELYGVKSISQEINDPGWRFDVVFTDFDTAKAAANKTGWDISNEDNTVLFPTSSFDSSAAAIQVILTTETSAHRRVLWRKWAIEIFERKPKNILPPTFVPSHGY